MLLKKFFFMCRFWKQNSIKSVQIVSCVCCTPGCSKCTATMLLLLLLTLWAREGIANNIQYPQGYYPFQVGQLKGLLQMLKMGVCRGILGGWVRKCYWFLKIRAYNRDFGHLSSNETNNFEELAYQRSRQGRTKLRFQEGSGGQKPLELGVRARKFLNFKPLDAFSDHFFI